MHSAFSPWKQQQVPLQSHAILPFKKASSMYQRERYTYQDQSGDKSNRRSLPFILKYSCSVGIFYTSLSRDKNQLKPFPGCSRSQEDREASRTWFTNFHYPGICSELLLIASSGSGVGSRTYFQLKGLASPQTEKPSLGWITMSTKQFC